MTDASVPAWLSLSGHTALITGAGSATGIGYAAARALAELGARVMLTATTERVRQRASELVAEGHTADSWQGDLSRSAQAQELVAATVRRFGSLDLVVNNAGMVSQGAEPEAGAPGALSDDVWRAGLARNLDSAFFVTRAALPHLPDGTGRIVMVASLTGPVMAMRAEPVYAAAKAGLVGLARSLAVDLAARGITANAVAPGWIATGSQTSAEQQEGETTPMRRSGRAAEVAAAIAWLCTPGAAYVTGQCLVVDGGNSVSEERSVS